MWGASRSHQQQWLANQDAVRRPNNFDLIRVLAATQVVLDHSAKHLNTSSLGREMAAINWFIDLFPGVPIFFVTSGFLIAGSFARNSSNIGEFFRNRALRIFPGIIAAFLLAVILMSIQGIITTSTLAAPPYYAWMITQVTVLQAYCPDLLRRYGTGHPNGALWTVGVEAQFYLLTPLVLFPVIQKLKGSIRIAALASLFFLSLAAFIFLVFQMEQGTEARLARYAYFGTAAPHLWLFLAGMILYFSWPTVEKFFVGRGLAFLAIYVAVAIGWRQVAWPGLWLIERMGLGMVTMALAYTVPHLSAKLLRGVDISYGIYIYHMLLVNVFVHQQWRITPLSWAMFLASVFGLAAISWFTIEKPFLRMKHRFKPVLAT